MCVGGGIAWGYCRFSQSLNQCVISTLGSNCDASHCKHQLSIPKKWYHLGIYSSCLEKPIKFIAITQYSTWKTVYSNLPTYRSIKQNLRGGLSNLYHLNLNLVWFYIYREDQRLEYEGRLQRELETLRARTALEMDQARSQLTEVMERDRRSLAEARDIALTERNTAQSRERETNKQYQDLLRE